MNQFKAYFKILMLSALSFTVSNLNAQTFEWVKQIGGNSNEFGYAIEVDDSGYIYLTGTFQATVDFDPSPSVFNLVSTGSDDIFIAKYTSSGGLVWAKKMGGSGVDQGRAITVDQSGNVYTTGSFSNTVDFDPNAAIFNLTATGLNIFITKLDAAGNLVWAAKVGGDSDIGRAIIVDSGGNVYVSGTIQGNADMDPSSNVHPIQAPSYTDGFLLKLNANGNFIWVRNIAGYYASSISTIAFDANENIIASGQFGHETYFTPGPGADTLNTFSNSADMFICKYTSSGDILWVKQFEGTGNSLSNQTLVDSSGNIYNAGMLFGTCDFDPGPGVYNITSVGSYDSFISKSDSSGNLIWAKNFGGTDLNYTLDMAIDPNSGLYLTGLFDGTIDFDPGAGMFPVTSGGDENIFISKFDFSGNFLWAVPIGNDEQSKGMGMAIDNTGNVYVTGTFYETVDFNPGSETYSLTAPYYDAFILKLSQYECANMAVIIDSTANILCSGIGFIAASSVNGSSPYSYTWNTTPEQTGSYIQMNEPGIYQLTVTDDQGCSKSTSILITEANFPASVDVTANLVTSNFRVGFEARIDVDAFNYGCINASGDLVVTLPPQLIYNSADPVPDSIVNNRLVWHYSNLNVESDHLTPVIFMTTDASTQIGDRLCIRVEMRTQAPDIDLSNNKRNYCLPAINGYDPNDKKVYPEGDCMPGYVMNDQLLTYTVRFQNTGNADAINIHIIDSLSPFLDISTVKIVGSSHAMYTEVLPNNKLNFVFNNIHLPDSGSNETESHGYVIFEVKPLQNLSVGTEIKNKVGIYFDFNPPVITNTVLNTISNGNHLSAPTQQVITSCDYYLWNGVIYTESGTYTQTFSNQYDCDSSMTLNLTINSVEAINVTQDGATLTTNNTGNLQWINCDNNTILPNQTSSTFIAPSNGNYAVIITKNNCSDTSACYTVSTVGINENELLESIHIFPNPSNGIITISSSTDLSGATLRIYDLTGKIQLEKPKISGHDIQLDISGLSPATYYLEIQGNENTRRMKLIKN